MLSDDKSLAAAILAKAVNRGGSGWRSIIDDYTSRRPSTREDLADLRQLKKFDTFQRTMAYASFAPGRFS